MNKGKSPGTQEITALKVMLTEGRDQEAAIYAQTMTERFPRHPLGWKVLGAIMIQLGRNADAIEPLQKVVSLSPKDAEAYNNLGILLYKFGRHSEADRIYHLALKINPNFADAHNNLGLNLKEQGRLVEAETSFKRALQINPGLADAHSNLGNTLQKSGRLDEAVASFKRALQINPGLADAHSNLGNTLQKLGRLNEAVASFRCALQFNPNFAVAYFNLGCTLHELRRLNEADANFQRALQINPDFADAHNNLGNVLHELGLLDRAGSSYRKAIHINPNFAEAHSNLGRTLRELGRLDESEASCRRALQIKPDYDEAHNNLGAALQGLGRPDEAEGSYRRALEIKSDNEQAYNNLLFINGYNISLDPPAYLSLARGWEHACITENERQLAHDKTFRRSPLVGRRLRVGYVSGDFRQHAVSYFVGQLFGQHDRERIELFAYANNGIQDAVTARLRAQVEHWIPVFGMTDKQVIDRIELDEMDVLIDLSGHTESNRLGVFARRAAPIQVHYLGYFASTGLTEIDYLIGDESLTPPETDSHFSEQVWRLPRIRASYDGNASAPIPSWRACQEGTVCLGSFNNLGKLTTATLAVWAKILHALPEGKLLLKTKELAHAGNRQRILDIMDDHGILSHRIELMDSSATPDWSTHMSYYDLLDIALDPIGAHGGYTTTGDALWMGVPVISLEGDRMASRMASSMLAAIGQPEWIARTETQYVDKVVALARDVVQRKALRFSQREKMSCSTLCDARGLAIALENAYYEMFNRWQERN